MAVANPDEDIDQTKAPLLDHLIELRRRLIYCIVTVLVFFMFCYIFAQDIYNFLLIPYRIAVGGETRIDMIYTAPQEFFFTQLRVAFFGAIVLSFPMLAAQLYMFVAPGLYRNERQAFLPFLVATPILFILGGPLVFFIVMLLALLARTGMVTSQWLRKQWRYAVVVIFFVAAMLAPPDIISMTGLAIPTLLLYEISILAVKV